MPDEYDDPDRAVQYEDDNPESLAGDDAVYDPDDDGDDENTPPVVSDRWLNSERASGAPITPTTMATTRTRRPWSATGG
jgi:hypothetical protein